MNEDLQKLTKEKFENWEVSQMDLQNQTNWFNENLIPYLVELLLTRDPIDMILVPTPLKDAAVAALSNPTLPVTPEFVATLSEEAAEVYMTDGSHVAICEDLKTISLSILKDEAVENLTVQNPNAVDAPDQFIRIITRSMRIKESFYGWAWNSGFMDHLQTVNPLATPTYQELRNTYFMAQLIDFASKQASNQVKQAVVGPGSFGGL